MEGVKRMAKTKARMTKSKKLMMGAMFLLVLGLLLFALYMYQIEATKMEIQIPVSKEKIHEGDLITEKKIQLMSVGRLGMSENVITDPNRVLGKYALRDYGKNEYFFATSLTADYAKTAQEKVRYGGMAISVNGIAQTANNEIKENDFIKIYVIMDSKSQQGVRVPGDLDTNFQIFNVPILSAVRVVGVYGNDSKSVDMFKSNVLKAEKEGIEALSAVQSKQISNLLLDVLPDQQVMLLQAQYGGKIHIVVLPKEIQDEYRKLWGIIDNDGEPVVDSKQMTEQEKDKLSKEHLKLQEKIEGSKTDTEKKMEQNMVTEEVLANGANANLNNAKEAGDSETTQVEE